MKPKAKASEMRYSEAVFNSTRTTSSSSMLPYLTTSSTMSLNTVNGAKSGTALDQKDTNDNSP